MTTPPGTSSLGNDPDRWQRMLADVAGDITSLDGDPQYEDLERSIVGKPPALAGDTLKRAESLVCAVHVLFRQYSLLNDRVNRAKAARDSVPRWVPGHPAMREVERVLSDPIELTSDQLLPDQMGDLLLSLRRSPSDATPASAPAPPSHLQVPPAVLLTALPSAIVRARQELDSIRAASDEVATIATRTRITMRDLAGKAATLGLGVLSELASVRATVADLDAKAAADPLGARGDFEAKVRPLLEEADRRVSAAQAERAALGERLQAAREIMQQLSVAHRRSSQGWKEAPRRVVIDPTTLRAPVATDAQLADLDQWLNRLEAMVAAGSWREASGPLHAWWRDAQPLLDAESEAARINSGPLDQLALLRGRLTVLRTVARSNGMSVMAGAGSPEEAAALAAYRAAERALSRPTLESRVDLARATVLVDRYAALVDPQSLPGAAPASLETQ